MSKLNVKVTKGTPIKLKDVFQGHTVLDHDNAPLMVLDLECGQESNVSVVSLSTGTTFELDGEQLYILPRDVMLSIEL